MKRRSMAAVLAACSLALAPGAATAAVTPGSFEATVAPGGSASVTKTISVPDVPAALDVCLLVDLSGSYGDDLPNLATAGPALYDAVAASGADARFGLASFIDQGEYFYQLEQPLTGNRETFTAALSGLVLGNGGDGPESQYEAIVAAAGPGATVDPWVGEQADCGWREGANRVLVVATDAPSHSGTEGPPYVETEASAIAALRAQEISLIGLHSGGAAEALLTPLAEATGGSVQPLLSDSANLAEAVLAGLSEVTFTVVPDVSACTAAGLDVTFDPGSVVVEAGTSATMTETIVASAELAGTTATCTVDFVAGGASVGTQAITVTVTGGAPSCPKGQRPGHGHGDKNHCHTGPPGQAKKR